PLRICAVRRDSLREAALRWMTPLDAARCKAREASRSSSVAWLVCFCWMAVCSFLITPLTPDSTARFRARRFRAWRAAFRVFLWTTGMAWLPRETGHECYHGVCSEVKERSWRVVGHFETDLSRIFFSFLYSGSLEWQK